MDERPIRKVQRERRAAPAEWFEGRVEMEPIHDNPESGVRQGRVHFHDGGRTRWHLHVGDQVLYFVAGQGMAEDDDGTLLECEPGDIVAVDAGAIHRHGARPGASATHIAITTGETIWDNDPRFPGRRGGGA
jgi:quercetin dioxygenase-like cupin family protein